MDRFARAAIFAIGYALAVELSEHVYGASAIPSPFWLPDAVLLCALLLRPPEDWWIFIVTIWPVRLVVGVSPGTPFWFELFTIATDGVKGVVSAWLLHRLLGRRIRLETLAEFLGFLSITAVIVPTVSAGVAAPARHALGDPVWSTAYRWFLGDALAQVIVTPVILYWCIGEYRRRSARLGELLILLVSLSVACVCAFGMIGTEHALSLVYVPMPFLLWAAVRLRPFGTANAIALVAITAMVGAARGVGVFSGEAASSILSLQLFLLVTGVSLLSLAILSAERDRLLERERELHSRIMNVQEQERARVARELHDDLAQVMAVLHLRLQCLGRSTKLFAPEQREVTELVQMSSQIASAVHALSHQLHPAVLDTVGLDAAVKSLCSDVERHHGLEIQYTSKPIPAELDHVVSVAVFRIVQEALRNVVKHSCATVAAVELSIEGQCLILGISDDGNGFDIGTLDSQVGLGLISMRERLHLVGGRISIHSTQTLGTRIRVEIPLEQDQFSRQFSAV